MSAEYESLLKYKTKVGKYEEIKDNQPSPQGRQRVYFTCHPDDFDKYFDEVTNEILSKQPNCAIYFYDGKAPEDEEDRDLDLNQMILFVIPVTYKFICDDECQARKDFKYAKENTISMLLLQQEPDLEELFNQKCGNYQMLSKFMSMQSSQFYDPTAITYDEKLTKYLESIIIGDDLVKEIQQAFDAYIFLSYRKKDRKYAQELMKLIHSNDFCRDIAIWYDEFLVSGEDFNEAIKEAMEKSKLFSMVVTPNLINEANYVQSVEYPAAKDAGKPVFPAEAVPTDAEKLKELYPDIPNTVDANGAEFSKELLDTIHEIAIKENDKDPKHNYLIGLAYLNGIDVEKNEEKAIELITSAAEAGLLDAVIKLLSISSNLRFNNSFNEAIKINESLKRIADSIATGARVPVYYKLASLYVEIGLYEEAEKLYNETLARQRMAGDKYGVAKIHIALAHLYMNIQRYKEAEKLIGEAIKTYFELEKSRKYVYVPDIASSFNDIANLYMNTRRYEEAEKPYTLALELFKELASNNPNKYSSSLAMAYNNLGALYAKTKHYDQANKFFVESLGTYKKLAEKNPDAYKSDVAREYFNLANLHSEIDIPEKAEKLYAESIEIYVELLQKNPTYISNIVETCNCLANFYDKNNRLSEAEKVCIKSLKICNKFAKQNPNIHISHVEKLIENLADIYRNNNCYEKAFKCYKKVAEQGSSYAQYCLGHCYQYGEGVEKNYNKAVEWYTKAAELGNEFAKDKLKVL